MAWYFHNAFLHSGHVIHMKTLDNERYIVINAYKFAIFERFFIVIYCVSLLSLRIKLTDSIVCETRVGCLHNETLMADSFEKH